MSESSKNPGNGVEEFHVFLSRRCAQSWFVPVQYTCKISPSIQYFVHKVCLLLELFSF